MSDQAQRNDAGRLTIACCVEYGELEEGTIRLAESLRRFGGVLSSAKLVAVTPRRGPALSRGTLESFEALGVEYVRTAPRNRYAWMPYLNKYFALAEAEKRATGDLVAWLDSDVLVVDAPTDLLLGPAEDFAACPRDRNIGTGSADDEFAQYWTKVAQDLGMRVESLPWVRTVSDGERIRLYWNAGVFVYRPASGFLSAWRANIERVLDNTDSSTLDKIFWTDQVALSFTAIRQELRLKHLSEHNNYGIATHFKSHLSNEGLQNARLLHYHDCMKPDNWAWFMETIARPLPEAQTWLAQLGPSQAPTDTARRLQRDAWRAARQVRRRLWSRRHGAGVLGQ